MGSLEHPFVRHLMERASAIRGRIAIPDAQFDARFLEAALRGAARGVVRPDPRRVAGRDPLPRGRAGWQLGDVRILDPDERGDLESMIDEYAVLRAKDRLDAAGDRGPPRGPGGVRLHAPPARRDRRHLLGRALLDGGPRAAGDPHPRDAAGFRPDVRTRRHAVLFYAAGGQPRLRRRRRHDPPPADAEELAEIAILAADKAKTFLPGCPPRGDAVLLHPRIGEARGGRPGRPRARTGPGSGGPTSRSTASSSSTPRSRPASRRRR